LTIIFGTGTKIYFGAMPGKDDKPCRVCTDFRTWAKQEKKKYSTQSSQETNTADTTKSQIRECPPDVKQLGRATWTFLHTMAAYYPDHPSNQEQRLMRSFLSSFSRFYPCGHCAEHLQEEIKKWPPRVESRQQLGMWMCEMHNKVNKMLGKDPFDCNKIDERWRDGPIDGSCD